MRNNRFLLVLVIVSLLLPGVCLATEITYILEDLGSGQWVCHYNINNDTLAADIEQFIIWYEPWLYQNLSVVSTQAIGFDWYQDTIEPDPVWLDYGAYRALAYSSGIGQGQNLNGFAVRFEYLGSGVPTLQEFDIVDPVTYASMDTGYAKAVRFVDFSATGDNDGTSWLNAFVDLQDALDAAIYGDEIRVAQGTYKPRQTTVSVGTLTTFALVSGTRVYGGFPAGGGTWASRDPKLHETILNGDINGDDDPSIDNFGNGTANYDDNTEYIFWAEGTDSSTLINGLTIRGAKSHGIIFYGGSDGTLVTDLNIQHCRVEKNYTSSFGGGLYTHSGTPTITIANCVFSENYSGNEGGGAWFHDSNVTITNSIFRDNFAEGRGGGICFEESSLTVSSSTLINNESSQSGGAIYASSGTCQLYNSIFWGNTNGTSSQLQFSGDNVIDNYTAIDYCCIQGWNSLAGVLSITTTGNTGNDPILSDDGHLLPGSSCINTGDAAGDYTGMLDIDGQNRVIEGRVDIGADEAIPYIKITKPTGGEVWAGGSTHTIEWETFWYTGNVNLAYSTDNGQSWTNIVGNRSESYAWTLPWLPAEVVDQCLISVVATTPPADIEYAVSEMFTITSYQPTGLSQTSDWPTLAGGARRTGQSTFAGPELGCVKWEFETDGPVSNSITTGTAGDPGAPIIPAIHIASEGGTLYTVNAGDGSLVWSYDTGSPLLSAPAVGNGRTIYVGADNGTLYAIDIYGRLRWTQFTGGFIYSSPTVAADGKIFVGSQDGVLYALGHDGSELWKYQLPSAGEVTAAILASPTIGTDGNVYVAALNIPKLYALDPSDGSLQWETDFQTSAKPFASPVVADDGTIYISLVGDEHLYAIDPNGGTITWQVPTTPAQITGQWDFDNNLRDSSGLGHDGVIYGNPNWVAGDTGMGSALYFDGTTNYVDITGYKGITGSETRSVSARIKTTGGGIIASWANIPVAVVSTPGSCWIVQINTSSGQLELVLGDIIARGPDLSDGLWHHVKVELTLEELTFYVDGTAYASAPWEPFLNAPINTSTKSNVIIGARLSSNGEACCHFNGSIDEVVIERLGDGTGLYCYTEPVIGTDGTIYVSLDDEYLRAFNPDGSSKWVKRIGSVGGFTMTAGSDGNVYTVSDDNWLTVLDSDGNELSRFSAQDNNNLISHPVITEGGTVLVSGTDNKVLAISSDSCDSSTANLHRPEDISGNRIVNFGDFAMLASEWLDCTDVYFTDHMNYESYCFESGETYQGYLAGDIDRDHYVNINDLFMMAQQWLQQE